MAGCTNVLPYLSIWLSRILIAVALTLGRWTTKRRFAAGRARSLWWVTPISEFPLNARADRLLGIDSESLVFLTCSTASDCESNMHKHFTAIAKLHPRLVPAASRCLLIWAVCRYDIFHYVDVGSSPKSETFFGIDPEDLSILGASGKRVFLYVCRAGVLARDEASRLGKWKHCGECQESGKFCFCQGLPEEKLLEQMCPLVTQAVTFGDMLAYVPGARKLHFWPIDLDRIVRSVPPRSSGALRIAHAVNFACFKGTQHLEAAIEQLRINGFPIEYVRVQGLADDEAIRLYGEADLVADQFIGGAYGHCGDGMWEAAPYIRAVSRCDRSGGGMPAHQG